MTETKKIKKKIPAETENRTRVGIAPGFSVRRSAIPIEPSPPPQTCVVFPRGTGVSLTGFSSFSIAGLAGECKRSTCCDFPCILFVFGSFVGLMWDSITDIIINERYMREAQSAIFETRTHARTHACTRTHAHARTHAFTHTHTHTHTHTQTHTHTHTHTHTA